MKLVAAVFALFVAGQSLGADLRLSYRDIQLGATLHEAEAIARQRFDRVQVSTQPDEHLSLLAGDEEGLRLSRTTCPTSALPIRRPNCLRVAISSRGDSGVDFISVTQSFDAPVPLESFMARLNDTYGRPEASYEDVERSPQSGATDVRTFLWGGSRTPAAYSMSAMPWDDFVLIGGRFVSAKVNVMKGQVIGYELRIADAERIQRASEMNRLSRKTAEEIAKQRNAEKVKF